MQLEYADIKVQSELTKSFDVEGSKVLLAFADDVNTVIQSTRDAKEIFPSLKTELEKLVSKAKKIRLNTDRIEDQMMKDLSIQPSGRGLVVEGQLVTQEKMEVCSNK